MFEVPKMVVTHDHEGDSGHFWYFLRAPLNRISGPCTRVYADAISK